MARLMARQGSKFLPALLALTSFALLLAAAPKPVKLTVVGSDGKAVAGELAEATPAGVTLKAAKGDPVTVPWSGIKSVSNGLTRQKVVDEWRTTHADRLCEVCRGIGVEKCATCNGTGVDPAGAKPCDKCKGAGDLGACPKCKDGKVPCPNSCLKASMFANLPVNADGKKHKTFHGKNGQSWWWSEGHVGELIVQENGDWVDKGKCPTCAGTTWVVCPTCHGTAKKECPACHGSGVTGPACTAGCVAGKVECKACGGTGLKSHAAEAPAAGKPAADADKP